MMSREEFLQANAERIDAAVDADRKHWERVVDLVVAFAPCDHTKLTRDKAKRLDVGTLHKEHCVKTDGIKSWLTGRGLDILQKRTSRHQPQS